MSTLLTNFQAARSTDLIALKLNLHSDISLPTSLNLPVSPDVRSTDGRVSELPFLASISTISKRTN